MSEGDGMAEVTEGDREKASGLLHRMVAGSNRGIVCSCGWEGRGINHERHAEDAIAAALAEEREKARAPFAALAQELATVATYHHATVAGDAYADAADRVIAIIEGTYR